MKKLLLLVFALLPSLLFAKDYTEVVEVQGKTADQLYSSAREWFADTFNSANDVLQMDDPVAGKLIGKGFFNIVVTAKTGFGSTPIILPVTFTMKVFVKDSVYKYEVGNIFIGKSTPFSLDDFEKASTPEGAKQTIVQTAGMKNPSEKMIKRTADYNAAIYKKACAQIENTIASLKVEMNKIEDDW